MTAPINSAVSQDSNAVSVESTALLGLVADIRAAVGDPTGKLMQDELIEHCRKLAHSADWNRRRVEMLSRLQKHMRDPERTLVCDILANGQLLPDPEGNRYGFAATGNEHHGRPNASHAGDGERKAWMTRQMRFEPLPACDCSPAFRRF